MALVLEGQHLMGDLRPLPGAAHRGQILRRHIGIAHALDDQQPALDVVDEMDGRALAVALPGTWLGEPPIICSL